MELDIFDPKCDLESLFVSFVQSNCSRFAHFSFSITSIESWINSAYRIKKGYGALPENQSDPIEHHQKAKEFANHWVNFGFITYNNPTYYVKTEKYDQLLETKK